MMLPEFIVELFKVLVLIVLSVLVLFKKEDESTRDPPIVEVAINEELTVEDATLL